VATDRVTSFVHKNEQPIESIEDWFRLAPPAGGRRQWKEGRSAKEAARRWLQGVPPEVAEALDFHVDLRGFTATFAEPEVKTELDEFPRKRNHDLIVEGQGPNGSVLLCVEAKADETFDKTVAVRLDEAVPTSNLPERIRRISLALFGDGRVEPIADLRYQLLQACAGSLIEAQNRRVQSCVLLVHVFRTRLTDDQRIADNAADLDRFVAHLSGGASTAVPSNGAVGPIAVPGYMTVPHSERLYIAKATADLTKGRAIGPD
jgi:hypothetical protein